MENIDDIFNHISASAPCSLFSVAVWVKDQLNMTNTGFVLAIDTLVSAGVIEVSADESGLIVDLTDNENLSIELDNISHINE
jgi:hypothetical protein